MPDEVIVNYSDTNPAAAAGYDLAKFQGDATKTPPDVSVEIPRASTSVHGTVIYDASGSATKYLGADGNWHDVPTSGAAPAGASAEPDWPRASATAYDDEFAAGPLAGIWSWINQGGAAAIFVGSAIVISVVEGLTNHSIERGIVQTLPAPDWEFTAKMANGSDNNNFLTTQLTLRESATNKTITLDVQFGGGVGVAKRTWTPGADSTFVANYVINATGSDAFTIYSNGFKMSYVRVSRIGVNLSWFVSPDGIVWHLLTTQVVNNYFTTAPDQIGLAINVFGSNTAKTVMACDWIRRTA